MNSLFYLIRKILFRLKVNFYIYKNVVKVKSYISGHLAVDYRNSIALLCRATALIYNYLALELSVKLLGRIVLYFFLLLKNRILSGFIRVIGSILVLYQFHIVTIQWPRQINSTLTALLLDFWKVNKFGSSLY